jgi:tetratricopeptide (TPR) repeat protein
LKDKNVIVSQELGEISSVESGQMNCLIVYPDRKHVKYIHQITNSLEEILKELDFSVNKLSDETIPDEHFGETFEFLAKDCDLAVVIFDGFRPNVLFEYGYLRGLKKIILPIKSKMASVAVKSLYRIKENADTREIQDHTGLTKAQFCHLKEPPLGYFSLLSDRYGINIIEVDCNAELSSKNHPKTKLKTEIEKLMPRIINSYTKTSFNATTLTNPNLVKQSEKIITKLLQYSARIVSFESSDIKNILKEINTLEQETNNNVPSEVYQTASSLFKTLTKQTQVYDASLIVEYSNEAIRMLEKSLNIKQDPTKRAKILTDIGTQYVEFSRITDNEEELLKQAIKSFDEALGIFTKEKHPKAYAKARHNLGFAYSNLSDIRNQDKNLKEAIRAFQDTLTVYRKEKFPIDYGRTQNNLGGAFLRLAEISNKEEDLKKAIEAYEEALAVYTVEKYPLHYASIQEALKKIAVQSVFLNLLSDLK